MKWFSLEGIMNEIKRIRWPSWKDLAEKSGKVLTFVLLFMAFFVLAALVISGLLNLLGITA
jgi:preprotein translocase SecE subunit